MQEYYWVPDYYERFTCKGGDCRTSCCQGWPISMSMNEYFRLLGMDCSKELRRKLDSALHIVEYPSPDRYAQLLPDWRGDCPMHREDGYCSLQCECGEQALTEICRLYPRSPRKAYANECACSNSCEHTLELLFETPDPLTFKQLPIVLFKNTPESVPDVAKRHYSDIRKLCVSTLQNRAFPLTERLIRLGDILAHLHTAFCTGSDEAIDKALASLPAPPEIPGPDENFALSFLAHINESMGMESRSVGDFARFASDFYGFSNGEPTENSREIFKKAKKTFKNNFPDWEIRLEKVLVNHVFYESFPFSDPYENLWDEFLSLSAAFAYPAFLAMAWTGSHPTEQALTDVLAAAFRLIDHSRFDWNIAAILDSRMHVSEAAMDAFILGVIS